VWRHSLRRTSRPPWCGWLVWIALTLFTALPARAQDHIVERALLEDRSGLQTIESIREESFIPFTGVLSQGYGAAKATHSHARCFLLKTSPVVS